MVDSDDDPSEWDSWIKDNLVESDATISTGLRALGLSEGALESKA